MATLLLILAGLVIIGAILLEMAFNFAAVYLFQIIIGLSVFYMWRKNRGVLGWVLALFILFRENVVQLMFEHFQYENEWVFPLMVMTLIGALIVYQINERGVSLLTLWVLEFTGAVFLRALVFSLLIVGVLLSAQAQLPEASFRLIHPAILIGAIVMKVFYRKVKQFELWYKGQEGTSYRWFTNGLEQVKRNKVAKNYGKEKIKYDALHLV